MLKWKGWVVCCCAVSASSVMRADFQLQAWQDAYANALRCDDRGVFNALHKLREYQRFQMTPVNESQAAQIDQALSRLVIPKSAPINVVDEMPDEASPLPPIIKKPARRKRATHGSKAKKALVIDPSIGADALKRAQAAYELGHLKEAERFYRLSERILPDSTEAKEGLEKVLSEMR